MNFSDLRDKEVINICDGRRLGRPIDLGLNEQACAVSLIVPGGGGWKCLSRAGREGLVIPWGRIRRIGDDVILVEIAPGEAET